MAFRNSDRLLVISKFILKEKLCSNFMITTEDKKEIPMEIYLLRKVNHPNIVTVLDVYENEVSLKMTCNLSAFNLIFILFLNQEILPTDHGEARLRHGFV